MKLIALVALVVFALGMFYVLRAILRPALTAPRRWRVVEKTRGPEIDVGIGRAHEFISVGRVMVTDLDFESKIEELRSDAESKLVAANNRRLLRR